MPIVCRTLHLGPLDNNTYLLTCPDTGETAVVDAGFEPDAVIAAVRREGLRVALLLATHAHYDHVCGMREVQEALGGTFWLHPADRPLLEALTEQGAMFGLPPATAPAEVHELSPGRPVALGRQALEVLHLPGHSPGHVGFHHGPDVWSGDVLFAGSVGRTDLPGGSWDELERSIRERLFTLGDDVRVLPGHGPATTVGRERRHNPYVGHDAGVA
jgi:glyoxylase-like metal-dependent hydrolase (beta-lactamase superfamily II)